MSLKSPDDEYDELVPEGNNFLDKLVKKYKFHFVLLIVGILLGIFIQFYFIAPFLVGIQTASSSDCITIKAGLLKENDCLRTLLPNVKASEECAARAFIEKQNSTPKDYNEEPTN
ncbi:MAG: hypothetical protein WCW13_00755 [archaeon]|jgi:hypothetical protein